MYQQEKLGGTLATAQQSAHPVFLRPPGSGPSIAEIPVTVISHLGPLRLPAIFNPGTDLLLLSTRPNGSFEQHSLALKNVKTT